MPRSRPHDHADDPPDAGGGPPRPHSSGGRGAGSLAEAQEKTVTIAQRGRVGESRQTPTVSAARPTADDIQLVSWQDRYTKLGDEPPRFNVARNDAAHSRSHTVERHGPDIPLQRDPAEKTIEGRIYGDTGWPASQNGSFKWNDPSTMNRTINDYVRSNWEQIRYELATDGLHVNVFDADHAIGTGYVNKGMYGAGPVQSRYAVTSTVRIRIQVVPGTDPPVPFIVTAFPTGLG
jgi:hypothetical protein